MIKLDIPQMSCNHCVGVITKTLQGLDHGATVQCDLTTHQVQVTTTQDTAAVVGALADAGYPATLSA